jgi:hypothetical protein
MNAIGIVTCLCFPVMLVCTEVVRRRLAARASGWRQLGVRYPSGASVVGMRVCGDVLLNARRCVPAPRVTVNGAGLHLAMSACGARIGHPPLFVPWDDVTPVLDDAEHAGDLPLWVGESARITLTGPAADFVQRLLARRGCRTGRARFFR